MGSRAGTAFRSRQQVSTKFEIEDKPDPEADSRVTLCVRVPPRVLRSLRRHYR
jgi:hypothetical protein